MDTQPQGNRAVFKVRAGKAAMSGKVEVSTPGLVAIGALVSSILLSTAALVWVATSVARDRPLVALLRRR
ncbi:hypothetical protein BH10PSE1_BH10PSE1_13550 [soil metagenome]|jgi:hypothetical protein